MMIRRRQRPTSPAPPLDNDDLLSEILLRLPAQPSSLPRASLICTRWRRLVSDPGFHRRFRARHRKPPLLGFFSQYALEPIFTPALDPPDRIPASRVCWRPPGDWGDDCEFLGFRHGRAVLFNLIHRSLMMLWDPVTGNRRAVEIPAASLGERIFHGAIRCVDGEWGHVHGDCHSS
uniref:F-box domain-containing protein n=1 Tax=Oryza glumipatula TaxID=40148 RepID=A0A0E0B7P3_9ORYZ